MNDDYFRLHHREQYVRWRKEFIQILGGKCSKCGTTDDLEFDHIDRSKKSFPILKGTKKKEAFLEELGKCQLLCYTCHKKKTSREQRTATHGTWGMYRNRGCRCVVCRSFVNAYHKEYKRKRRLDPVE